MQPSHDFYGSWIAAFDDCSKLTVSLYKPIWKTWDTCGLVPVSSSEFDPLVVVPGDIVGMKAIAGPEELDWGVALGDHAPAKRSSASAVQTLAVADMADYFIDERGEFMDAETVALLGLAEEIIAMEEAGDDAGGVAAAEPAWADGGSESSETSSSSSESEGSGSDAEIVPPPPEPPDLPAVETVALASRVKLVGMKACEVQEDDTIIRELGSIGYLGRERKV